jgi:hypothetical protein
MMYYATEKKLHKCGTRVWEEMKAREKACESQVQCIKRMELV